MRSISLLVIAFAATAHSLTAWQQRNETYTVPDRPITSFASTNFTTKSSALTALSAALGPNVTIAYAGNRDYGASIARVWTQQRKTYPEAIVYPETALDVSIILQFYGSVNNLWADGFAIMGGGHADFGRWS